MLEETFKNIIGQKSLCYKSLITFLYSNILSMKFMENVASNHTFMTHMISNSKGVRRKISKPPFHFFLLFTTVTSCILLSRSELVFLFTASHRLW